jgi:hypothetical protein
LKQIKSPILEAGTNRANHVASGLLRFEGKADFSILNRREGVTKFLHNGAIS